ncbi:MAG: helicase-exonuclease AddAB subunit AddA [Lachnospiraceae bacterium]|nr:helicase-exonuclease AddAB subunit AddA [Lachnospiraceae bacterium]
MKWTSNQQRIIDHTSGNLLVAAGAGSGKTAVLTEHIVEKISDGTFDIDRLLVVTFTNAAAREMKDRIRLKLRERLSHDPSNSRLRLQESLIASSDICTIDSLCGKIVKQYFYTIGVDPGMKVGDGGELELMKNDVCLSMLEKEYEEGNIEFLNFRDMFSGDIDDNKIIGVILKLYNKSRSFPDPDAWLSDVRSQNTNYRDFIKEYVSDEIVGTVAEYEILLKDALEADLPDKAIAVISSDIDNVKSLEGLDFDDMIVKIGELKFENWKCYGKNDSADLKKIGDAFKDRRSNLKGNVTDIKSIYAGMTDETLEKENSLIAPAIGELIDLTKKFGEMYGEEKDKKSICDFNDVAHRALKILYKDGEPSDVAMELSEHYQEVLIDEYQDCNDVQESLMYALSRCHRGENNIFMVGDVKQSIYGFRQANPGIFLKKYNTYASEGDRIKIELSDNFRSRSGVIDFINDVFRLIMKQEVGGIDYNDDSALNAGAEYPQREALDSEVLMLVREPKTDVTKEEQEAKMVAARVVELMNPSNPYKVKDSDNGMRDIRYGDIAILCRSLNATQNAFVRAFREYGIPLYCENEKGFFSSIEIQNILDYLRIVDNPLQDIPLAASMRNVFGEFSARELSDIRLTGEKKGFKGFANCVMALREDSPKVNAFLENLERYRNLAVVLPIHELIIRILEESGYNYYVSSLPGGDRRMLNIKALISNARNYENTTLKGLFNFIRYIERLKKYEVDVETDSGDGSGVNAVRLMSIHKSKGLEFPVVILAGLTRQFNDMDTKDMFLVSNTLGVGCEYRDPNYHIKMKTFKKRAIAKKMGYELREEELRVLYVGMTRAKELLILSGSCEDDDELQKYFKGAPDDEGRLPTKAIASAKNYMEWIMGALVIRGFDDKTFPTDSSMASEELRLSSSSYSFRMVVVDYHRIPGIVEKTEEASDNSEYEALDQRLKDILSFRYPHEALVNLPAIESVSDIKMASMDDEFAHNMYDHGSSSHSRGDSKDGITAADIGTAVHKVMELIRFEDVDLNNIASCVDAQIEELMSVGKLSELENSMVRRQIIYKFFESNLAARMCEAAKKNNLYKEKQFLIGIPAHELYSDVMADDNILVRGIIDAFFIEDDHIVLMDYKTDATREIGADGLVKKYRAQLEQYKTLLNRMFDMNVSQTLIYSFSLGQELEVNV